VSEFSEATFDWMMAITLNNSREQFLASKAQYEESVKGPFVELLTSLSGTFGGTPKVFRPNRDIRFSKDKRPYKSNVSGYLEGTDATYYLDLSADGLMAATGYYQMGKDQLARYRAALTPEAGDELREIIRVSGASGEGLKTVPRGIPKDHPCADLLRFTSLTNSETLSADEVVGADLRGFATRVWTRAAPLNQWLNDHVGPSSEPFH
jgi:uncharacterized protein (TIGR02453 family)